MNSNSINPKIINYLYYLVCLLPIGFISGPLIPDLIIVISSIVFLYLSQKYKLWYLFKNKFVILLFIFYLIIVISSSLSENILFSFKSSLFYFRFIIFCVMASFILKNKTASDNLIFNFYFYTILVLIIDSYVQYLFGKNLIGLEKIIIAQNQSIIDIKITSFFGEDEILGSFLSKMLPIISALYFLKNENRFNLKSLIFVTAIIISIFLTSERAAFIQALMFLTLFFIFGNFKKKILFFICLIVPLFLGVLVITNFDDNKKQRMIKSPIANLKQGRISSHHQSHFITGINMFKDQIMIGHGPKTFRILCKKYKHDDQSCSNHPHNTYIQLLAETGILGFGIVAFLFLFISSMLIKNLYIKLRHSINVLNNDIISILCGIFVYIWPISPHGNFFNNWLSGMLFLQIAILIFLNSIKFVKLNK